MKKEKLYGRLVQEFWRQLQAIPDSPESLRMQVIVTNGFLELLVNTLVEGKCKHGKNISQQTRDYPYSVKLLLLHEKSLIDDRYFGFMDWFRKVRNRAAHDAFFEFSESDFAKLKTTKIIGMEGIDLTKPENFKQFGITLVLGFWNCNVQFFAPIFMPELFANKNPCGS
jgi:hypothetical protein